MNHLFEGTALACCTTDMSAARAERIRGIREHSNALRILTLLMMTTPKTLYAAQYGHESTSTLGSSRQV